VNAIWRSGNNGATQAVTALADLNWSVVDGLESGDLLQGGAGANTLYGTVRSDVITGGAGNDTMTGGPGADLFRYLAPNQGQDSITDFQPGVDKIQVVGSAFGGLAAGALPANNFVANGAPEATQAVPQFLYNTATGMLAFDADGTGGGAAVNLVTLVGQPAITVTDMVVAGM
jgi:serralysin